jgi:hypothetical protein
MNGNVAADELGSQAAAAFPRRRAAAVPCDVRPLPLALRRMYDCGVHPAFDESMRRRRSMFVA